MKKVYRRIFNGFNAPVVPLDCGEKCRHLNDGIPVCCDIDHAVPVMDKSEYKELRSRSKLWRKYRPENEHGEELVDSLHKDCVACECKGAKFCERDNRSLSCRAFPFFPYIDKDGDMLGLATYWTFEDRCWVISNMKMVTQEFVEEFFETYEYLFKEKPDEFEVFKDSRRPCAVSSHAGNDQSTSSTETRRSTPSSPRAPACTRSGNANCPNSGRTRSSTDFVALNLIQGQCAQTRCRIYGS